MFSAMTGSPRRYRREVFTQPEEGAAKRRVVRDRVAAYDGIRGLGVIVVMGAHANLGVFLGAGVAVDVFFALSGYLITTLLLNEHRKTGRVSLRRFYARRGLRLLPALLLMVAVVTLYSVTFAPVELRRDNLRTAPAVLLYFGNWIRATGSPLGSYEHTWSLSVEEQFYLAWPLLLVLMCRRGVRVRRLLAACAFGAVAPLVVRMLVWRGPRSALLVFDSTYTRADSVFWGCLLAVVLYAVRTNERHARWAQCASWVGVAWLVGVFTLTAVVRPHSAQGFGYVFGLGISGLAGTMLVANLTLNPWTTVARTLSLRPLSAIGRASYGLYLFHFPIFVATDIHLRGHGYHERLLVKALLTAVAGTLSYTFVEKPFLRRKHNLAVTAIGDPRTGPELPAEQPAAGRSLKRTTT
jgi:peptidoglycan/LPS O-acetylase OafA/YrhL